MDLVAKISIFLATGALHIFFVILASLLAWIASKSKSARFQVCSRKFCFFTTHLSLLIFLLGVATTFFLVVDINKLGILFLFLPFVLGFIWIYLILILDDCLMTIFQAETEPETS